VAALAYINGVYKPIAEPALQVIDRGFQFADAVYEVWSVRDGLFLDEEGHFERLARSLRELQIKAPMAQTALRVVLRQTARLNRVRNGLVYLQVSRGAAKRDHAFPPASTAPTMVVTATRLDPKALAERARKGVSVITAPDIRWGRCDIKTVGLLPNALARQAAKEQGAQEALLVDRDGFITEASASNFWCVAADGEVATPPLSPAILHGVTRATILRLAMELGLRVAERPVRLAEALDAREAFITSATAAATPVIAIDGRPIADGAPGPVAKALRDAYFRSASRGQP
jgi:D-alanine transaminase